MASLIQEIEDWFGDVTLKRATVAEGYTDGRRNARTRSDVPITACVQQPNPEDLLQFPEGLRTKKWILVISEDEIRGQDDENDMPADLVSWEGEDYEVQRVEDWLHVDIDHYEAYAVRKQE